ncbi:pleckstrin homology domain-containing family G member 4B isoform X2 [Rhineura floridana]|uniref:pleckstrin homology domain-containing family G member 4B isoform X2 n=1 Tax=Rhineura floridana TaxID=261503 RepID=UPI002AC888F3|nr:pleckstrin homology domain-containing family G member 4B isoform X2 [Rhineura floridana]XP_061444466.1 pleckstrin homology domain-containing family G member 4B isoform X2 [Rhineura floridana]
MNHQAAAPKTRGDNYLSIKDSESLDTYIQNTLSSLYPPFEATAATVLWQLFSIVEKFYCGDGLRCLIDFLVPAKRVLQCIQRETCGNYTGLIFYHEGWPLCIHEKIIVQLASLHKVRLKPGDFYFQIVPVRKQSASLVLKCLSRHGQGMEELIVPETMYGYLFTTEFLETINYKLNGCPLQSCLLTTGPAVCRTPWKNIVNPVFVPTTETILQTYSKSSLLENLITSNPDAKGMTQTMESNSSHESSTSNDTCSTVIQVPPADSCGNQGKNDSGLYHGLGSRTKTQSSETKVEKETDNDVTSRALSVAEQAIKEPKMTFELTPGFFKDSATPQLVKRNGTKSITFSTDLSSPRQRGRDSLYFETKHLFRKSYMEALQNPMNLGSSSEESIAEEESLEHAMGQVDSDSRVTEKTCENSVQQESSRSERLSKREETREAITFGNHFQTSKKLSHETAVCRSRSRRSQSLDRTHKNSQNKDYKSRVSSDGVFNTNPPKIINGHSVRLEKLESHIHEFITTKSKEDKDLGDSRIDFRDCKSNISAPPLLLCHDDELLATNTGDPDHLLPNQLLEVNQELLQSGVISLCGNRDRGGRAVVQVCIKNVAWLSELSRVKELTRLLVYYYNIPRNDVSALGLLILVDARKSQNIPALFKALAALQNAVPHSIHSALILTDKESAFKPDKEVTFQCEVLTSLKALHRFIDCTQLTAEFGGTFLYNHNDWICFRRKLEPFITNCKEALVFLQHSLRSLSTVQAPSTAQEVSDLMNKHKTMMKLVLEDELLVSLRLEGGTVLARLRKEEFCNTEDYRDAMETITKLYNRVDEEVHRLVLLSNKCLQQLENLLAMRKFEEGCEQIKVWFENEGEKYIGPLDEEQLSVENVKRKQEQFLVFSEKAMQYCQKGLLLIKENSLLKSEEEFQAFSRYLTNITIQTEKRKNELEKLIKLYEFYEKAHKWMVHCNEYLDKLSVEAKYSQLAVQSLQSYHQEATKVSAENFQKVSEVIIALGNKEELKQWNILWLKCQQTRHHLEEVLSEVVKGSSKEGSSSTLKEMGHKNSQHPSSKFETQEHSHSCRFCSNTDNNILDSKSLCPFQHCCSSVGASSFLNQDDTTENTDVFSPVPQTLTPLLGRFQRTSPVSEDLDNISTCYSEPIQTSSTRHRTHPLKKIMKKTQSFELTRRESHSELHQHGYTGVYIRGLEVASNVAVEKRNTQRANIKSPVICRNRSLSSPSRIHHTEDEEEKKRGGSKMNHIMDEMITTEREYVRSLGYIINSYFPEMERVDLPQDLRGKRNIIFGNLEKLYDFHCQYFLKELEQCTDFPLRVSHCFLRHEEQFGMYALYSKNKPQSDALLISHGNTFFKNKQEELGDKMNLASYLLKPIQRMSKYALLLKDLIKECSATQEQELSALRVAEEMVKFQLRHGNDLLAMDAIRGCDVNLKEQGQLRCQDEFIVCCGRKKYLRHVFLFEDLILFSKTKKIDGGYDIYMYKQSFKTAEIGMTENVGDTGLRFEIWFRRRRKSQDAYILQSNSAETKIAWTNLIGKILWRQALRNRELRMQEMVSMGIGNKPFMDIKPSDAAISDRAIDYIMKGAESRTRASIAISSFDHSTPFKRPHSTISNSSTSSSSSQSSSSILGSLNLHVYSTPSHPGLVGPPFYHWSYDVRTCIEEDELEQDTGSQPSMITENSESSQCTLGESASGSAQSGFSPYLKEAFLDEGPSNSVSKSPSQCTSPAVSEKNPSSKSSSQNSPAVSIFFIKQNL